MIDVHHFAGHGRRMMKPTIHDVADAAQVSLATVDRVLNKRGGVAAKSMDKVEAAVVQLGYVRDAAAANLSRNKIYRFCFVLPEAQTGFVSLLRGAIEAERGVLLAERVALDIVVAPSFDVARQVAALRAVEADAVAVMASEAPEVQAEIGRLSAAGVPVVTLVADLPRADRAAYVGPDNVLAGRTAAGFMGQFLAGRPSVVLPVAGSLAARDHSERLMGFRAVMGERFEQIEILPAVEGFDDAARVAGLVRAAGAIAGIYAIGAGTRGLVEAVGQMASRPVVVAHELTDVSRQALRDGQIDLVIDQNPAAEVAAAIRVMRDLVDRRPGMPDAGDIEMKIYIKENVR
jgi:LacI family transcriptional regulator